MTTLEQDLKQILNRPDLIAPTVAYIEANYVPKPAEEPKQPQKKVAKTKTKKK